MLEKYEALRRIAYNQYGYFTAMQAIQCGYAKCHHGAHVCQGTWQKIDWGLFRLPAFSNVTKTETEKYQSDCER